MERCNCRGMAFQTFISPCRTPRKRHLNIYNSLIKNFYKCHSRDKALICLLMPLHENMMCNIFISYVSLSCVSVFIFLLNIKAVVGSGSKGTSKYMGEGVTCGSHFILFRQDASGDAPQLGHDVALTRVKTLCWVVMSCSPIITL